MKQKIISIQYYLFLYIITAVACSSCSDVLEYKKRVAGRYYLIEDNSKNYLGLYYKTSSGDFIGRIPATVLEYGFNDSYIVAKCMKSNVINYYIINRKNDSDYAELKDVLIASSISEADYMKTWSKRLDIKLNKVRK